MSVSPVASNDSFHPAFGRLPTSEFVFSPFRIAVMNFVLKALCFFWKNNSSVEFSNVTIRGRDNNLFGLIVMRPKNIPSKAPVLVYAHGGAFALSYLPRHLKLARDYAELAECCVVFVDYRVGAKAVFPKGFEDVGVAMEWVFDNADKQGFDSRRVVVGGDSAGGALAASLAQKLTADSSYRLLAQMLIYPALDSDCKTKSAQEFIDTPLWNARSNRNMWAMYLSGDESKCSNSYASPMAAEKYEALPEAYIENAEFDPLRDEARIYAQRLLDAGVSVELNETRQTVHSYDILKETEFSQSAIVSRVSFLKSVFRKGIKQ